MKGQRASWLKGPFLAFLVNPSETMVPSLRGGAWGRVSCTALPGASWGRLVAECNTGRRGLLDAFGARLHPFPSDSLIGGGLPSDPHIGLTRWLLTLPSHCAFGATAVADGQCVLSPLLGEWGVRRSKTESLMWEEMDYVSRRSPRKWAWHFWHWTGRVAGQNFRAGDA